MKCPHCQSPSYVIESRASLGDSIRRRRICTECLKRFSSYEIACIDGAKIPDNLPLPKNVIDRASRMASLRKAEASTNHRRKRVCKNCEMWTQSGTCSREIPEAGGLTAVACKHFESIYG
jgi:transcriptional regulator NrdR family protein